MRCSARGRDSGTLSSVATSSFRRRTGSSAATRSSVARCAPFAFRGLARIVCSTVLVVSLGACRNHADATGEGAAKKEAKSTRIEIALAPKAQEAARLTIGTPSVTLRRTGVTAAGSIDFVPSRVARVGPSVGGRVAEVKVTLGQVVSRGAVVVTLESVEVGRARTDHAAAQSRLAQADAEVAREQRLLTEGATSERALLLAKTEKSVAESAVRAAEQRLQTLGAKSQGAVGSTAPLVTPLGGRVLEVNARVGQPVGPTDTLVVIGETNEVWLTVDIYERSLGLVHVGDEVKVTAVAHPGRVFVGKVDHVGEVVDRVRRVVPARIVLPNEDGALRPGMTATARILGAPEGDGGMTIAVPRGAIQTIDALPFVFIEIEPGKYEMRPIERGADLEDGIEVLRGLQQGDRIVTEGGFILKSEVLREQMGAND